MCKCCGENQGREQRMPGYRSAQAPSVHLEHCSSPSPAAEWHMALGSLQPDFSSDYLTSRTRVAKRRQPLSETGLWGYLPSRTP